MPVRYRNHGLEVDCLVPRWADVAYYLEQDPRVFLVILDIQANGPSPVSGQALRWLEYRGTAQVVSSPDWAGLLPEGTSTVRPDDLYLVIHVTPERIDLHDESRGWGARETLEL